MLHRNVKNTERMVRHILAHHEKTRSDDKGLLIAYMAICGLELKPHQEQAFRSMPTFESITRCRRKIQEGGEYLPTQNIAKERHDKAQQYKQEMIEGL